MKFTRIHAASTRTTVRLGRAGVAARALVLGSALLGACSGADVAKPGSASIAAVGTFMGTGIVASTIEAPVHLVVTDDDGLARPNVTVHFTPSGDGKVSQNDATTDNAGVVETRWTLGSEAGMQTLTASAREFAPQLFTANATPDRAATVQLNTASAVMSLLGDTLHIVSRVTDRYGNAVTVVPTFTVETGADVIALAGASGVVARARGNARVRVSVDTAKSTFRVAVNPELPSIDGVFPDTLVPGGRIQLAGNNFALAPELVELSIAGVRATITKVSATSIEATLPAAASFPCAPTGAQAVRVTVAQSSASRSATLRVANRIALAVGESQNVLDAQQVRCTELVEPSTTQRAKYVVAVLNTSVTAATSTGFELNASAGGAMAGQVALAKADAASPAASVQMASSKSALVPQAFSQIVKDERNHSNFLESQRRIQQQAGSPLASWAAIRAAKARMSSIRVMPSVGDTLSMKAIYSSCSIGRDVRARVVYIGTKSVVLEDITAPNAGRTDAQYRSMGQEFDNVEYPLLKNNLGDPLAMDATLNGDGRVTMLFTRYVNDSLPGIQGYTTACNFYPKATYAASNEDEVFYARVPAAGEDAETWRRSMRSTVLHESKHLASFAQRIATNTPFEESWLEESTARIAEELYSRTFAGGGSWKGNGGYATSMRCEIYQCDDRPLMMWKHFSVLHQFFAGVDTLTPIGAAASGDFTFYASGWSLVRWAADNYALDESQWLRDLVRGGTATGLANLAQRTGHPVEEMLADWSLANAVDDRPGFTPKRSQLSFPSWNVPDMMAGLASADPVRFGDVTPLRIRAFSFGSTSQPVDKLRAFSSSYFSFEGQQSASQVFELRGENNGALPGALRVAIVRVE